MKHRDRFVASAMLLWVLSFAPPFGGTRKPRNIHRNRLGMMPGQGGGYGPPPGWGGVAGGMPGAGTLPGMVTNTPAQTPMRQTTGIPVGASGLILISQRYTSATALTPPVAGYYLCDVCVEGGATPGGYAYTYATPNVAIFTSPPSGVDATGAIGPERAIHYPISWLIQGTSIPAATTVFKGGLGAVTVTFSNVPPPNTPDMSAYRAVYVTGTESGTGGTARTITFDAQPGYVRGVYVMINVASGTATGIPAGNITYPAYGQFQQQVAAQGPIGEMQMVGVMPFPASNTVSTTHTATALGAATTVTIAAVHFY